MTRAGSVIRQTEMAASGRSRPHGGSPKIRYRACNISGDFGETSPKLSDLSPETGTDAPAASRSVAETAVAGQGNVACPTSPQMAKQDVPSLAMAPW